MIRASLVNSATTYRSAPRYLGLQILAVPAHHLVQHQVGSLDDQNLQLDHLRFGQGR